MWLFVGQFSAVIYESLQLYHMVFLVIALDYGQVDPPICSYLPVLPPRQSGGSSTHECCLVQGHAARPPARVQEVPQAPGERCSCSPDRQKVPIRQSGSSVLCIPDPADYMVCCAPLTQPIIWCAVHP